MRGIACVEDADAGCAAERCNERDDERDGAIDEGFDLCTDPASCGRTAACSSGACAVGSCARGGFDDRVCWARPSPRRGSLPEKLSRSRQPSSVRAAAAG